LFKQSRCPELPKLLKPATWNHGTHFPKVCKYNSPVARKVFLQRRTRGRRGFARRRASATPFSCSQRPSDAIVRERHDRRDRFRSRKSRSVEITRYDRSRFGRVAPCNDLVGRTSRRRFGWAGFGGSRPVGPAETTRQASGPRGGSRRERVRANLGWTIGYASADDVPSGRLPSAVMPVFRSAQGHRNRDGTFRCRSRVPDGDPPPRTNAGRVRHEAFCVTDGAWKRLSRDNRCPSAIVQTGVVGRIAPSPSRQIDQRGTSRQNARKKFPDPQIFFVVCPRSVPFGSSSARSKCETIADRSRRRNQVGAPIMLGSDQPTRARRNSVLLRMFSSEP